MARKINRKRFLEILGGGILALLGLPHLLTPTGHRRPSAGAGQKSKPVSRKSHLVVARGEDPYAITVAAISALGGAERFVKKGDRVVIKPNIAFNRAPELAATTNPEVVAAIVDLCLKAGAKEVKVFDRPVNPARMTYHRSGIAKAAKKAGARVVFMDERKFEKIDIPQGKSLKSWPLYREALEADVLINVPIAKHHSLTRLTLGMKNIMGLLGGNRGRLHWGIAQKLADLNTIIPVHFTVMDAYRVLTSHGPSGGRPEDVRLIGTVIAGVDRVAVDAYTTSLFGLEPEDIGYITKGHQMGLGEMDMQKVEIEEIRV
ncbi:MAG TPA: DUF362 domain-containing protein [Candidatus Latescibacteria bacterium]|nr:DUF362 domain-containing protein [Candidatus Latescibacterota bacterium]